MCSGSLWEHAAAPQWFMILSVSTRFLLSLVHCINPVSVPMAACPCWFINGFLLSLGTCCCPPLVHCSFCFSTSFLLSHGPVNEPWFRPYGPNILLVLLWVLALSLGTCRCSPMVHGSFYFSTRFLLSHGSLYEPCFRLWGLTFLLVL